MIFSRIFLLLFYFGNTILVRHGKTKGTHPKIEYFGSKRDSRRNFNIRLLQKIIAGGDFENAGEWFSKEDTDLGYRRAGTGKFLEFKGKDNSSSSSSGITSVSTSLETREFKEEWKSRWDDLKLDALKLNKTYVRNSKNIVNMVAARPWHTLCGDPFLHDVPYGTCTLKGECEGEYRIYNGDIFCGRTQLVCCAVEGHWRDLDQAFDVSFVDSSRFSTSSEEKLRKARGSKENRRRKKFRREQELQGVIHKRKRKIKALIRTLVKRIRSQLNRSYRNNSDLLRLAIANLKILVKAMKKKYKANRETAYKIHCDTHMRITDVLLKKLSTMRQLNRNFLNNATFTQMTKKGTIPKTVAWQLLREYPELIEFPELRALVPSELKANKTRRSAGRRENLRKPRDFLQCYI